MFTRSSNSNQPMGAAGHSRRAFRDVTNSNRNGNVAEKSKISVVKRNAGVKTRSMSMVKSETAAAQQQSNRDVAIHRRGNFGATNYNGMDDRNDAPAVRKPFGCDLQPDPNSYQMTGNTDNVDERDRDDPLCATGYVQDMYNHFREKELITSVRPLFMENQPHINERMRSILVDWLVEVHLKFKLVPETLYLTVNLIDRFLEREKVSRPRLQLVGVTSLLIASKYEEIYPPELRDLVYICDQAYTRQDIIEMEETILKTLQYQVTIPSAHAFLVRYLKAGHADKKIVQLSCYLLDGTLQSYHLLNYLPSQLAAAAVFIARRVVGRNAWSPTMLKYAAYCEEQIIPVARALLNEKANANTELKAVNKKYLSHRYGGVANTVLQCDI